MAKDSLRIGGVPYGVGAALLTGLDEDPSIEVIRARPTLLIPELRAGQLDAALVSTVEGFRHPGYCALSDIGIAARGAVRSVRAFRKPGREIRTVAVDAGSACSVALMQCLLAHRLGATNYELRTIEPDLEPDRHPDDLVMLIGDAGVAADPGNREVLDLGQEWFDWTGLPFVFAMWFIPETTDVARVAALLRRAHDRGIAEGVQDGTKGAVYYQLGESELQGMERFREEAAALELTDKDLRPRLVGT